MTARRCPRCGGDVDNRDSRSLRIQVAGRRWHYECWRASERDREWLSEVEAEPEGGVE